MQARAGGSVRTDPAATAHDCTVRVRNGRTCRAARRGGHADESIPAFECLGHTVRMTLGTGIFNEVPEGLDESWRHGALVGGMADPAYGERLAVARSFKQAGDMVLEVAIRRDATHEVIYPVLFTYRHAVELYLKAIVPGRFDHDLLRLIDEFAGAVEEKLGRTVPSAVLDRLREFHDVDPGSTTFRYADQPMRFASGRITSEAWVDLRHQAAVMSGLDEIFGAVLSAFARTQPEVEPR